VNRVHGARIVCGMARAFRRRVSRLSSIQTTRRHAVLSAFAIVALGGVVACNAPVRERAKQPPPKAATYPVTINEPDFLGGVQVPTKSASPKKLRVTCRTCHSLRGTTTVPDSADDLKDFHKGLIVQHGDVSCSSCHDKQNPQSLRLASGERISSADVMRQCAQCHGSQKRDYDHGAHGGMRGYWDLSRGPRSRNNCVDCHAAHTPAFRGGMPVLPPRDRFVAPKGGGN
jgi:hypothetical protein